MSTDSLPLLPGHCPATADVPGLSLAQCWGRLGNCVTDLRLLLEEGFLSPSTNSSRLRIPGLGVTCLGSNCLPLAGIRGLSVKRRGQVPREAAAVPLRGVRWLGGLHLLPGRLKEEPRGAPLCGRRHAGCLRKEKGWRLRKVLPAPPAHSVLCLVCGIETEVSVCLLPGTSFQCQIYKANCIVMF